MIQDFSEKISSFFTITKRYISQKREEMQNKISGIAISTLFSIPAPDDILQSKIVLPVLKQLNLSDEAKNYALKRSTRLINEIFSVVTVLFLTKYYPNKVAIGCLCGMIFPDLALQATSKFWDNLFHSKVKGATPNIQETDTKIIDTIGYVFYKMQPVVAVLAVGYLTYPAPIEILPIAAGARFAAACFRSDLFIEKKGVIKTERNRSLSL